MPVHSWDGVLQWLTLHVMDASAIVLSLVADMVLCAFASCKLGHGCNAAFNLVMTITNLTTKILFMIQLQEGGNSILNVGSCPEVPNAATWRLYQLGVLVLSHTTGIVFTLIVICRGMESFWCRRAPAPGDDADEPPPASPDPAAIPSKLDGYCYSPSASRLDKRKFRRHMNMYAVIIILGSGNLATLALLPWTATVRIAGMPSASLLVWSTLVTNLTTNIPQILLQAAFIQANWSEYNMVISVLSLLCTGFLTLTLLVINVLECVAPYDLSLEEHARRVNHASPSAPTRPRGGLPARAR